MFDMMSYVSFPIPVQGKTVQDGKKKSFHLSGVINTPCSSTFLRLAYRNGVCEWESIDISSNFQVHPKKKWTNITYKKQTTDRLEGVLPRTVSDTITTSSRSWKLPVSSNCHWLWIPWRDRIQDREATLTVVLELKRLPTQLGRGQREDIHTEKTGL